MTLQPEQFRRTWFEPHQCHDEGLLIRSAFTKLKLQIIASSIKPLLVLASYLSSSFYFCEHLPSFAIYIRSAYSLPSYQISRKIFTALIKSTNVDVARINFICHALREMHCISMLVLKKLIYLFRSSVNFAPFLQLKLLAFNIYRSCN